MHNKLVQVFILLMELWQKVLWRSSNMFKYTALSALEYVLGQNRILDDEDKFEHFFFFKFETTLHAGILNALLQCFLSKFIHFLLLWEIRWRSIANNDHLCKWQLYLRNRSISALYICKRYNIARKIFSYCYSVYASIFQLNIFSIDLCVWVACCGYVMHCIVFTQVNIKCLQCVLFEKIFIISTLHSHVCIWYIHILMYAHK